MLLRASEMDPVSRRGAETEHSRALCEAFRNEAWAREALAQPKGYF